MAVVSMKQLLETNVHLGIKPVDGIKMAPTSLRIVTVFILSVTENRRKMEEA